MEQLYWIETGKSRLRIIKSSSQTKGWNRFEESDSSFFLVTCDPVECCKPTPSYECIERSWIFGRRFAEPTRRQEIRWMIQKGRPLDWIGAGLGKWHRVSRVCMERQPAAIRSTAFFGISNKNRRPINQRTTNEGDVVLHQTSIDAIDVYLILNGWSIDFVPRYERVVVSSAFSVWRGFFPNPLMRITGEQKKNEKSLTLVSMATEGSQSTVEVPHG